MLQPIIPDQILSMVVEAKEEEEGEGEDDEEDEIKCFGRKS